MDHYVLKVWWRGQEVMDYTFRTHEDATACLGRWQDRGAAPDAHPLHEIESWELWFHAAPKRVAGGRVSRAKPAR